jgi:solute carrier family 6 amino acid transporter-like protein 5/7/9/14
MEWPLVLCLLATWILVFICLFRGIKTSGKVRKKKKTKEIIYI